MLPTADRTVPMGRSGVTVRSRLCYVLKAGRLPKSKLKRPTALVVDDDSPVLQDRLRRWQNAYRWIRFGRWSVSQVYPSLFRSARNFCSAQIGSNAPCLADYAARNLHLGANYHYITEIDRFRPVR